MICVRSSHHEKTVSTLLTPRSVSKQPASNLNNELSHFTFGAADNAQKHMRRKFIVHFSFHSIITRSLFGGKSLQRVILNFWTFALPKYFDKLKSTFLQSGMQGFERVFFDFHIFAFIIHGLSTQSRRFWQKYCEEKRLCLSHT